MISARARAALLLGIVSFSAYALSSPPALTWEHNGEDGPEFAAVGALFGITHPTGYPLFTLLLRLAAAAGGGVGMEPARAATLLTALCAAGAVALLAGLLMEWLERAGATPGVAWCGLTGAALLAVSPNFWGQANITEVYPLHLLFVVLLLRLATSWRGSTARLALLGYVAGLGLAHHLTTTLLAPPVLLLAARRGRLTPRALAWAALALVGGVTLYAVLLLRSRLDPPLDWGNPETLGQFVAHLTGRQYQNRLFHTELSVVLERVATILGRHLPAQLGPVAWPLGLLGVVAWARRAGAAVAALLALFALQIAFVANYTIPDPEAFYLPALLAWAGLCAFGLAAAVEWLRGAGRDWRGGAAAWAPALLLAWPLLAAASTWPRVDLHRDDEATRYAREAVSMLPPDALVLSEGDGRTFALWYGQATQRRFDAAVVYRALLEWPWYIQNLRHHYPGLNVSADSLNVERRATGLLDTALGRRPVFTTFSNRWLARTFMHHPEGPLYVVDGRRRPIASPAGSELVSRPLTLGNAANSTDRIDAGQGGRAGAGLTWGTVLFQPAPVPGDPGALVGIGFEAGRAGAPVRVRLNAEPTRAVCLLVTGRNLRGLSGVVARARVLAGADTLGRVDVEPFRNLWDAPAVAGGLQIPDDLEVLPASSLSVVMLQLDEARPPEWLELTGAAAEATPGDSAGAGTAAPGLFVVAITQVVRR